MTIFIFILIAILLYFAFAVYRKFYSVTLAILIIFIPPLMLLFLGAEYYENNDYLTFFSDSIPGREFYHLISIWLIVNLFCSALIVRNYISYLRVNKKKFWNS